MDDDIAARGEGLAAAWLEAEGWTVLERNWARDIGELDIVAAREQRWGETTVLLLAFVEVKTREHARGPLPEVRVNAAKRRKIATLGKLYLAEQRLKAFVARFDVIGVDLEPEAIRHHASAFDAAGALR